MPAFLKAPALLAAALFAAPTQLGAVTETGVPPSAHPEVVRVDCIPGRGSAFKIGPGLLISVAHVTGLGGCVIDGKPITILRTEGDFAVLQTGAAAEKWLTIDCDGFRAGRKYTAIGFARGLYFQTTIDILGMGETLRGFNRLWGVFTVIPGMSGGPIIDAETGKAVGTINVYDPNRGDSGSVALKDTSLCRS